MHSRIIPRHLLIFGALILLSTRLGEVVHMKKSLISYKILLFTTLIVSWFAFRVASADTLDLLQGKNYTEKKEEKVADGTIDSTGSPRKFGIPTWEKAGTFDLVGGNGCQ